MGAPSSGMKAAEQPAAETLLSAFKTIDPAERRRHASVLNYWLSIRGDKEFPPLHDLDPLELSDAGPNSILLELISGGHDAEVRHLGEGLEGEERVERIIDAPNQSILACVAKKLPIVAISRDFLAFEDEFEGDAGPTRCWVTLLPLSAGGAWVDYVYALVSAETVKAKGAEPKKAKKAPEPEPEPVAEEIEQTLADETEEQFAETEEPVDEAPFEELPEPVAEEGEESPAAKQDSDDHSDDDLPEDEPVVSAVAKAAPGFSKLLDSIAGLTGFYGSQPVKVEPVMPPMPEFEQTEEALEPAAQEVADEEPVVETATQAPQDEEPVADHPVEELAANEPPAAAPIEQTTRKSEGTLQDKLSDVRAKADEARMAKLRANAALYEGLSAAYDFALDAEEAPEEYLRLVEAQGLKIQLRSPMKPVVKLAFAGMCDDATIKQLEAVLAWAFDEELPRGALADRIEAAGGVSRILSGEAKAA